MTHKELHSIASRFTGSTEINNILDFCYAGDDLQPSTIDHLCKMYTDFIPDCNIEFFEDAILAAI